jgi:hypothetical protein
MFNNSITSNDKNNEHLNTVISIEKEVYNNNLLLTQPTINEHESTMDVTLLNSNSNQTINNIISTDTAQEQQIIEKYAENINILSPEFIQKLPTKDQTILNKIIDEQSKIFPEDTPFTLVQTKNKNKNKSKDNTKESITPKDTSNTNNNSQQQSFSNSIMSRDSSPFKFGNITSTPQGTPIKNNTTNVNTRIQNQSPIVYGRGPMQHGRGGGLHITHGGGNGLHMHPNSRKVNNTNTSSNATFVIPNLNPSLPSTQLTQPYTNTSNENKQKTNVENNAIPYKTNVENRFSFCIHIRAKAMKTSEELTIESLTEHILQSFIKGHKNTKLLSTPSKSYQQLAVQSIYLDDNNETLIDNHHRYTSCLEINNKGNIYGNLWFTIDIPYPTLKRSTGFRLQIYKIFNIYFNINNLNTKTPTEIGYFIHRIVRHNTVESTTYTRSFLPSTVQPFQQEQVTIFAGPSELRRTVSVMSISTKYEDASEMTKLFENTFKNKTNMTFISKNYYLTLDEISKLQFIESQIAYTKMHRSILLRGIKETHVPSIHTTQRNKPLLLTECLRNIKDYQGNSLFTQIYPPVNSMVEVHILNKNLSLALEWEKHSVGHIA